MLSLSFELDEPTKVAFNWRYWGSNAASLGRKAVDKAQAVATAPVGRQFSRDTGVRARALESAGVPEGLPADLLAGVSLRKGLGYGSLAGAGYQAMAGATKDENGNDIPLYQRLGKGAVEGALAGGLGAGLVRGHVDRMVAPHLGQTRDYYSAAAREAAAKGLTGPVRLNKITQNPGGAAHVDASPLLPQSNPAKTPSPTVSIS